MKSLKRMRKNEKEKFVIPKSVQDVIPIKAVYKDGIFLVGNNLYSKTFKFTDINYNIASDEDKQELMKGYWAVINSFGAGVTVKMTINNHQLDRAEFEKSILLRYEYDGLDNYRKEYNDMLLDKAALSNCIVQDKYFTVTVSKKSIDDARAFFNRVGNDLTARLSRIDSKCLPVNAEERLRIFHNFYRSGDEQNYNLDFELLQNQGCDIRDFICPDSMDFENDYMTINDKYCRVIFLRNYGTFVSDDTIAELTSINRNLMLSVDFLPTPTDEAIGGTVGPKDKSIIDRCCRNVYANYIKSGYKITPPTLKDFREELLNQPETEAQELALALELFTDGSLNTFAQPTNVDINNRLICYDILDLGEQLLPVGMLVVLDNILNRITSNRTKGRTTYIFIDEIYLLFAQKYTADFLYRVWKRVRKYGAFATGITQNVGDMLQSNTARTMLANSEFTVMLNQNGSDRLDLSKLLNISDNQTEFFTNVQAGHGLMKIGGHFVPYANEFPKNTELYKLMTTKPGENI